MADLSYLLRYCETDHQKATVEGVTALGTAEYARQTGRAERNIYRMVARLKSIAAAAGEAPHEDLSHTIPEGFKLKGISQLTKSPGGDPQWLKMYADKSLVDVIPEVISMLSDDIPKVGKIKTPTLDRAAKSLMNLIAVGDPHLDMLAHDKETGANWDLEIARQQHIEGVKDLIDRAPKAHRGVLCILGDSLHRDSLKALTPGSGNLVDVDGRLSRSLWAAFLLFREMAERMAETHKQVTVVIIRGNHSETLEMTIRMMLQIAFEKTNRVEVLDNTSKHVPLVFGKNFLLMTHGDRLNDQKKADIASARFRSEHGAAKFTHVLTGHVHHESIKEISGCSVETFQALPTPDAWHTEAGYVTSDQSISLLTYHEAGGITSRLKSYPRIYMEEM